MVPLRCKSCTRTYDTIRHWWVKHDCMAILQYKDVLRTHTVVRSLLVDASPIGGWNYLCARSFEFRLPKVAGQDEDEAMNRRVEADLAKVFHERRLPVTVLGYGNAAIGRKLSRMLHVMKMESGTTATFDEWTFGVRHICTDKEAERLLEQCPNVAARAGRSEGVLKDIQAGALTFADDPASFLFPHAVSQPRHLHILYNPLSRSVKVLDLWGEFEGNLQDITALLGDKSLRHRFIAKCVPPKHESLFKPWPARHCCWVASCWPTLGGAMRFQRCFVGAPPLHMPRNARSCA